MKYTQLVMGIIAILLVITGSACTPNNLIDVPTAIQEVQTEPAAATDIPAVTDTPAPSLQPTEESTPVETIPPISGWVAFIGRDGNLRLVERSTGEERQLTEDAVLMQQGSDAEPIRYCCMQWSPDGNLLSYMREESIRIESGYNYDYTFILYDFLADSYRTILEDQNVLGYDWQPGTHLIAYGLPVNEDYWLSREETQPELANGIQVLNADTGETSVLVEPERGFTLGLPRWSPDGRFISFEEIEIMEGRGMFAYYDVVENEYTAWEEVVGSYSWSPDGEWLAYDRIGYRPMGGEQIWLRPRVDGEETALSPESQPPGYVFAPSISPDGGQIAYLANTSGMDAENFIFNVFVIDADGGEPRDYGTFEQVWQLHWTSDGNHLVFSAGVFEERVVYEINLAENQSRQLAEGDEAVPQP